MIRMTRFQIGLCCSMLTVSMLSGCGSAQEELRDWTAQERSRARPRVEPITPPQKFIPQTYLGGDAVEPFATQKLTVAIRQELAAPNPLITAELNRRKEPLESFPLDGMKMVGSVNKRKMPYALLQVDKLLYQVKVGDYLGQNYGKIMKITETEISLREIVQDASGDWIERPAALQLQEGAQ